MQINTVRLYEYIKIISNSFDPKISSKIHPNIKFYNNFSFPFFWNALLTNYIIISGDELTTNRLDNFYHKGNYLQGKYRLFVSFILTLLNKKIVFYKIGIYSFQSLYPIKLLKYVLKKSLKITVRDSSSKKFIKSFCKDITISVSKDPGYNLNYKKIRKTNKIGIAIRTPLKKTEIDKIKNFIKRIIKRKNVVFLIFSRHQKLKEENDLYFLENIFGQKIIENQEIYICDDPKKMKSVVSSLDFLLTQRYHGAVFADSTDIDFKVLSGIRKIDLNFSEKSLKFSELKNLYK